ncbi:MAG: hypothetical protein P8R54_03240 [Myxococcota bacterium]|nr:hypothetical protein [Myxococcota bacterium]
MLSDLDATEAGVLSTSFSGRSVEGDFFYMLLGEAGSFTLTGEADIEGMEQQGRRLRAALRL